jgi:hypothetical protein
MTDAEARVAKLQLVERWTLGLGAALSLVAFAFGRQTGLSVSMGAALMIVNAFAIRRVGEHILRMGSISPGRAILLFNVKLLGLVAAIWAVITYLHVSPIAFVVGLSVYPLAIFAFALTHVAPPAPDSIEDPNG